MDYKEELKNHLDDEGRLRLFPSKRRLKLISLLYLAQSFESGRTYTEKEVNAILNDRHTFDDPYLLRRELFTHKFFGRERNGSAYWLELPLPTPELLGIEG